MFSEEEFKRSFEKADKDGSGAITADEIENLLFETYGFPPLEEEVKSMKLFKIKNIVVFMEEFDANKDGKVTWEEFREAMQKMKDRINGKAKNATEYKSYNKLMDDRYKHRRMHNEL